MTPTLYDAAERQFTSNGLGQLTELYDVDIEEQRNGLLEFTGYYPSNGRRFENLQKDAIILAQPNPRDDPHAFRIVSTELDITGEELQIIADSITNDEAGNLITDVTISNATGQDAMTAIQKAAVQDMGFEYYSDIETKSSTSLKYVNALEAVAGTSGSLLQLWGGELKRENNKISLLARRGFDEVTSFRLGKNIDGLKYRVDWTGLVTQIYPYYKVAASDGVEEHYIAGEVVTSKHFTDYSHAFIQPIDASQEITVRENASEDEIKKLIDTWAANWFTQSSHTAIDLPAVSLDLDLLSLDGSGDYAGVLADLEKIGLCDSVTVYVPEFGVNVTAVINELHFDPMTKRVTSFKAGTARQSFADANKNELQQVQSQLIAVQSQMDYVATSANGKNANFYGNNQPVGATEGDLWYYKDVNGEGIKQLQNGVWTTIVDSKFSEQVKNDIDAKMVELDATMADNQSKLDENTKIVAQVKTDTTAAVKSVNDAVAQAQADTADAVKQANEAMEQARATSIVALDTSKIVEDVQKQNQEVQKQTQDAQKQLDDAKAKVDELQLDATNALNEATAAKDSAAAVLKLAGDTDKTVSLLVTKVDKTANTIESLATKTDVDGINKSVNTIDTQVKQNTAEIKLKATSTSVQALQDTVDKKSSELKLASDKIAAEVTAVQQTSKDATAKISSLEQTADGFKTTVSSVQSAVDNLQVGGRNYLEKSSTFKWPHLGEWHVDTETYQDHAVLTGTQTVNNSAHGFSYTSLPCVNSDVVISFYAKAAKSSRLHSEPHGTGGGSGATDFRLTTEWARYSYKAHIGPTGTVYWWAIDTNIQMWVSMPQVEIGTMATDWSPAPEDITTQFSTLEQTVDGFKTTVADVSGEGGLKDRVSKVEQTAGEFKVSMTDVQASAKKANDDLANLQVGGRNLLKGAFTSSFPKEVNGKETTIQLIDGDDGEKYLHVVSAQNGGGMYISAYNISSIMLPFKKYTVSADIKGDGAISFGFENAKSPVITLTSDWKRYSVSYEFGDRIQSIIWCGFANFYIRLVKLESGTIATDWSPAPEDVDSLIADTTKRVSTLEQTTEGFKTTVSAVENMQVGGTNLLKNGDFTKGSNGFENWVSDGTTIAKSGDMMSITATATGYRIYSTQSPINNPFDGLTIGDPFSVSFDAYSATAGAEISIGQGLPVNQAASAKSFKLTTSKARYNFTGTCMGGLTFSIFVPVGTTYFGKIKVERGNKATDWSPAPEDVDSLIADTTKRVSTLEQTADGFKTTVGNLQNDVKPIQWQTISTASDFNTYKTTGKWFFATTSLTNAPSVGGWGYLIVEATGDRLIQTYQKDNSNSGQFQRILIGSNNWTDWKRIANDGDVKSLKDADDNINKSVSEIKQTADEIRTTVTNMAQDPGNLVSKSWFDDGSRGDWSSGKVVDGGASVSIKAGHSRWLEWNTRDNYDGSNYFPVSPGEVIYVSGWVSAFTSTVQVGIGMHVVLTNGNSSWPISRTWAAGEGLSYKTGQLVVPANAVKARGFIQILQESNVTTNTAHAMGITLSRSPNGTTMSTLVTQTANNWSVFAKNNGLITGISVDANGVIDMNAAKALIQGGQLHITSATSIDNAVITSAKIASLDAAKITTGSLSADRIASTKLNANNITSGTINADRIATTALNASNITAGELDVSKFKVKNLSAAMLTSGTIAAERIATTKLNANNITTGTISGANLAINLNTGQVTFQKGRIHSSDNAIDVNIDQKYLSVADGQSRILLKGGEMQFIQPTYYDQQTSPYMKITNNLINLDNGFHGASIQGRDYVSLTVEGHNDPTAFSGLGFDTFAGIRVSNNDTSGLATIVGGGKKGTVISGGGYSKFAVINRQAMIRIGYSQAAESKGNPQYYGGNEISIDAENVYVYSAYAKTSSDTANLVVGSDGRLMRSTSASKYKADIERTQSSDMAKTLITLPIAHWHDRAEMARFANGEQTTPPKRSFGMIAEDLASAGLEELVVRGDDGQLEGISYDRIAPALIPLLAEMQNRIDELERNQKS